MLRWSFNDTFKILCVIVHSCRSVFLYLRVWWWRVTTTPASSSWPAQADYTQETTLVLHQTLSLPRSLCMSWMVSLTFQRFFASLLLNCFLSFGSPSKLLPSSGFPSSTSLWNALPAFISLFWSQGCVSFLILIFAFSSCSSHCFSPLFSLPKLPQLLFHLHLISSLFSF